MMNHHDTQLRGARAFQALRYTLDLRRGHLAILVPVPACRVDAQHQQLQRVVLGFQVGAEGFAVAGVRTQHARAQVEQGNVVVARNRQPGRAEP